MPYIGKQLVRGQNRKLDDISSGFNGSQTTFTLQIASQNVSVGSALQLWISVGGVIQNPLTDFTIAGNQITFTTAPAASLDFFGVIQGDVTDTNTPGDATVTTSKLATGLTVNLADGSAATSSLQLGGTDSGLFSSAADKVNVTTGGVERLEIGSSEVVFNDGSNDVDFRVESNGNTGMLFVDGGNDRVGIGTTSPANNLDIAVDANNEGIQISSSTNVFGKIDFHANRSGADAALGILDFNWNNTQVARIIGGTGTDTTNKDDGVLQFHTAAAGSASEAMRIDSSGRVLLGTTTEGVSGGDNFTIGATNHAGMTIRSGTSNRGAIYFSDGTSGNAEYRGYIEYDQSADYMRFGTGAAERIRIDSSGRVLLGTTTEGVADGDNLTIADSGPCGITLRSGSSSGGAIYFSDATSGAGEYAGFVEYLHSSDALRFASGGTERMRIDSSGNVELGRAGTSLHFQNGFNNSTSRIQNGGGSNSSNFKFLVTNSGSESEAMSIRSSGALHVFNSDVGIRSISGAAAGTSVTIFRGSHSGTGIVSVGTESIYIFSNGNVQNSNNSYGQISDVKLKENIVDANSQWNDIKGVQVRNFNFKEETGNPTHTQIGVVAQELETVSPGLVYETPDTDDDGNDLGTVTKSVNYSVLYMKAVKALQEAMERIETLETKVAALEAG